MSRARRFIQALAVRLGASVTELVALAGIFGLGAVLRFISLPTRGYWDADQGTEMLAIRAAVNAGRLPIYGPEAISVTSAFHHGALYYDILMPAAWLGNGDPTWVVAEIALYSLIVIPIVWWIARTMTGPAAGLIAALLAATSATLIGYSTFIWNPTLIEPGAAIAFLGGWQAIRTRRARWWFVAAAGAAIASQAHLAAAVIVVPLGAAFLWDLGRAPAERRKSILAWGIAGVALFVATYLPYIISELTSNFVDTRGMIAYFSEPNKAANTSPPMRVVASTFRILAWPLTRWPMIDLKPAFGAAFGLTCGIVLGLIWRLGVTGRAKSVGPADEKLGVRITGFWLLLIIVTLGIGLHAVSEVQDLPTDQYHAVADPLVIVAVALILGGLWQALTSYPRWITVGRRIGVVGCLALLLAWNGFHWPALTAYDGGWPAAEAAAQRVERDAAGGSVAFVPLFADKGSNAYIYPLTRDGAALGTPADAATIVVLCDTFWTHGCAGTAEATWLASQTPGSLTQVDRFNAAPDRVLTVYRRGP